MDSALGLVAAEGTQGGFFDYLVYRFLPLRFGWGNFFTQNEERRSNRAPQL